MKKIKKISISLAGLLLITLIFLGFREFTRPKPQPKETFSIVTGSNDVIILTVHEALVDQSAIKVADIMSSYRELDIEKLDRPEDVILAGIYGQISARAVGEVVVPLQFNTDYSVLNFERLKFKTEVLAQAFEMTSYAWVLEKDSFRFTLTTLE